MVYSSCMLFLYFILAFIYCDSGLQMCLSFTKIVCGLAFGAITCDADNPYWFQLELCLFYFESSSQIVCGKWANVLGTAMHDGSGMWVHAMYVEDMGEVLGSWL